MKLHTQAEYQHINIFTVIGILLFHDSIDLLDSIRLLYDDLLHGNDCGHAMCEIDVGENKRGRFVAWVAAASYASLVWRYNAVEGHHEETQEGLYNPH